LSQPGEFFRGEIADGRIPGAIVLIQQHGRPVYFEKFGVRDVATGLPMTDDTIFTVYSMSKPVTSVAAMMLVDEGKLKLDEMISRRIKLAEINGAFEELKQGEIARSVIMFDA
jgi:CubicO group peptidase (beta-lactamase class C family)